MERDFLHILFVTTLAGVGGTGLGGLVGALFHKNSAKTVSLLLSFAGGVMLSIVCFDMVIEALDTLDFSAAVRVLLTVWGIAVGFIAVYGLNRLLDEPPRANPFSGQNRQKGGADAAFCRRKERRTAGSELFLAGLIMASAIALHNLPEGMVIGASYAATAASAGLLAAVVIGLHNIPEGMAVSVPLISGGMRKSTAILLTAGSGAPTVLGAVLGYAIGRASPVGLCLALSFAAGAMLYAVFGELLPESNLMWRSKAPAFAALAGVLVGLLIIYL